MIIGYTVGAVQNDDKMCYIDYDSQSGGYPYLAHRPVVRSTPEECVKDLAQLQKYTLYGVDKVRKETIGIYELVGNQLDDNRVLESKIAGVLKKVGGLSREEIDILRQLVQNAKI